MLDYTQHKRKFFPVKLLDGTVLHLLMPKKRTFEKMAQLEETEVEGVEGINELYNITAEILSNNLQKKKYSGDKVGDMLDIDEVKMLYSEYLEFVSGIKNDPN